MDLLSLVAKLSLDSSEYESGLGKAKSLASTLGNGVKAGLKVAGAAIGAATTAVMGFATASVKTGMTFDSSMSQVAATMGMSMDEMMSKTGEVETDFGHFTGNLRDYAKFMGANTAFSAKEAADALNYMALAGYDVQTSMEMLPNVLNLAAAGTMDLATASDMVTDTQTAFGISLERTSQMVDEMAKAASTGNTSVQQLGEAFLVVGGLAQELNGGVVQLADESVQAVDGVQELEIALTAMANAGIKGSEAGTHMRNMLLKLSSPTDEGAKQLRKMGVEVFDTEGKMRSLGDVFNDLRVELGKMTQEDKIKVISDLFNTRDLASAEALLNAVNTSWDSIGESILDAEGAASKMAATQLDNLAGDVTLLKSAFEGAQIAISDKLTPALHDFAQMGIKAVSNFAQAVDSGGLSAGIDSIGQSLSEVLTNTVSMLPQAIDAGVQLLTAIGDGLVANADVLWDSVEQVAVILGDLLVSGMETASDALADFDWAGMVANIADFLNEAISSDGVADFLQCAESILQSLMEGIGESAPVIAEKAPEIITNIVTGIIDNIDGLIDGGIKMAEGLADGMMRGQDAIIEQIPKIFESLAGAILRNAPKLIASWISIHVQLMAHVPQLIAEITVAIAQGIVGIINQIILFGQQLIPQIISIGSQVLSSVVSFLSQLPTKIAYWVGLAVGRFTTALAELPAKAKEKFDDVMSRAQEFFNKFVTEGPKSAKDMADKFIKAMNNLPANIKKIGKDVVEKLKEGIQSAWGAFVTWLLEKLASIGSAFAKGKSEGSKGKKSAGVSSYSAEGESTVSSLQRVLSEGSNDLAISHRIEDANEEKTIDYDRLASAMVKAFEQTDFTMEIDDREFGRIVRKAVAY